MGVSAQARTAAATAYLAGRDTPKNGMEIVIRITGELVVGGPEGGATARNRRDGSSC